MANRLATAQSAMDAAAAALTAAEIAARDALSALRAAEATGTVPNETIEALQDAVEAEFVARRVCDAAHLDFNRVHREVHGF